MIRCLGNSLSIRRAVSSVPYKSLSIVESNEDFLIINKPSGINSYGVEGFECVVPQLTNHFKRMDPRLRVDPNSFKVVQRLDRFVSGGLVVARTKNFANWFSRALRGKTGQEHDEIKRQYLGLLAIDDTYARMSRYVKDKLEYKFAGEEADYKGLEWVDDRFREGRITYDIDVLQRDDRNRPAKKRTLDDSLVTRSIRPMVAMTRFNVVAQYVRPMPAVMQKEYPELAQGKLMVPLAIELGTGRKNQIREHVLKAFGTTLLNDDKFKRFKMISLTNKKARDSIRVIDTVGVNSTKYVTNQIGLHCGRIAFAGEEWTIPVGNEEDRYLFGPVIDKRTGEIKQEVINAMRSFQ